MNVIDLASTNNYQQLHTHTHTRKTERKRKKESSGSFVVQKRSSSRFEVQLRRTVVRQRRGAA